MTSSSSAPVPDSALAAENIFEALREDKPWGHELIFAMVDGKYVGKILHVGSGHALSLQRHESKEETICVLEGRALVDYGPSETELTARELGPNEVIHLPAGIVHRVTALTDLVLAEASTADPGWREDITRFEDRYGREGNTAP